MKKIKTQKNKFRKTNLSEIREDLEETAFSNSNQNVESIEQKGSDNSILSAGWMDAEASYLKNPIDKIIIADDQHINIEVLQQHFESLDVLERCEFFYNGQVTIDRTIELVRDAIAYCPDGSTKLRPIAIMLLDFQMPTKNGIEVVNEVRALFKATNENLEHMRPELRL